jgi:nucleoid-associated protein YgaU
MQRDYKIGLVSGLVLAIAALVWVATRPSLSPEARLPRPSQPASPNPGVGFADGQSTRTDAGSPPSSAAAAPDKVASPQPQDSQSSGPPPATVSRNPQSAIRNPQSDGGPDLTIYEKAEKIKTTKFHIVRKEETLSAISQLYYGTPNKWQKIVEANKAAIKDPGKLQPGTKLIIPE